MFKQTKLFINSLPSLKKIEKFAKDGIVNSDKNKKNLYFLKLCLDIYEHYYKTFDIPLMKNYKDKFLKTAIKFYSQISRENFNYINRMLEHITMKAISKINNFSFKIMGD